MNEFFLSQICEIYDVEQRIEQDKHAAIDDPALTLSLSLSTNHFLARAFY